MADYTPSGCDHFYSVETALSLELPAGRWRMEGGTVGSVSFVYDPTSEERTEFAYPPRIDCRLVEIPGSPPDAYRHLAGELVRAAGAKPTVGVDTKIDSHPAQVTVVASTIDGFGAVVQQQALAQVGEVVLTVVATASETHAERFLPDFERTVNSIRVISEGAA
jgi:hypothetical protein